ncbi:MAG TPA: peptidoglycan-binding domain-containing protein [Trebonia sp.]|nr:peptidoglycan-binding domain-containing protein [Trebonia sp.]
MTAQNLSCADSTVPQNLLDGYDAYLGYVDGDFRTYSAIVKLFPDAYHISMTVFGGKAVADGVDCEEKDTSPEGAADWVEYRLTAGYVRPIVYASISGMPAVIEELASRDIAVEEVRLLSAHYGEGEHICGPDTCKYPGIAVSMDGTQWTDAASGRIHSLIDASVLKPDFFESSTETWEEQLVATMPEIKTGDTGKAVRIWQGVLIANDHDLGTSGKLRDGIDGDFGNITDEATRAFQEANHLTVDGEVGQQTWTAGLTVE